MSNINRENPFTSLSTALREVLEQWTREYLHTAIPGIIDTYDSTKRRARRRAPVQHRTFNADTGIQP